MVTFRQFFFSNWYFRKCFDGNVFQSSNIEMQCPPNGHMTRGGRQDATASARRAAKWQSVVSIRFRRREDCQVF